MVLMMDINGVLDCAAVGAASVISRKRTPTNYIVVFDGNRNRVFGSVMREPVMSALERFKLFLIGAGGVEDVMIVNVVDDLEIGFGGWTNFDRIRGGFRPLLFRVRRSLFHDQDFWYVPRSAASGPTRLV